MLILICCASFTSSRAEYSKTKNTNIFRMLLHLVRQIRNRSDIKIVLASTSPRRRQIFEEQICLPHLLVTSSSFDEGTLRKADFSSPAEYVMHSAMKKAEQVFDGSELHVDSKSSFLVIGADTIVYLAATNDTTGQILEKPRSAEAAHDMLRALSGREHKVITGVALIYRDHLNAFKSMGVVVSFVHTFVNVTIAIHLGFY